MNSAMSLKPFFRLLRDGRLTPLLGIGVGLRTFYKLTYLAAAGESGLLNLLATGPASFDALAEFVGAVGQGRRHSRLGCKWVFVCACCIWDRAVMH